MIADFPGGEKTFLMMYIVVYVISKGLSLMSVATLTHRAIQLGGWHWHKCLYIPVGRGNNMPVWRMTELALQKLERYYPERIQLIKSVHMITNDEIGQSSAEFDNVVDNIVKVVCGINVHKAKNLHLQHMIQLSLNLL